MKTISSVLQSVGVLFCAVVALVAGIAFATGQGNVTWGTATLSLSDGGACIQTLSDGGFIDGGAFTDGGIQCTDGGVICPCGVCAGDAGIVYNVPQDGGWQAGAAIGVTNSDPVGTEASFKTTCQCFSSVNTANSVFIQLQGSTDVTNPQVWLNYANASFSCTALDGGAAICGSLQYLGNVATWTREQITAVFADGGGPQVADPQCCCTYEAH